MRLSHIASLLALLIAAPALHASPITYQMTFTSGGYAGTGTLTLASQLVTSGVTNDTVANQQIQSLTFTVDNHTFDFSADPTASAQFINGQISKINFNHAANPAPGGYTVEFASGFSLYGSNLDSPLISGSYKITPDVVSDSAAAAPPASSPTPEPGTLSLLTTAALLGGCGFLIFRARHS